MGTMNKYRTQMITNQISPEHNGENQSFLEKPNSNFIIQ